MRFALIALKYLWFSFMDAFFIKILKRYPILYFDKVANVGDQINPYLVKKITGKDPYNVKSKFFRHTVGLGSMFHMASKSSTIWGTGIISDAPEFASRTDYLNVTAVRGMLTKAIIARKIKGNFEGLVLGDPGLLMPSFYNPTVSKRHKVGVIPHYVDACNSAIASSQDFLMLDVSKGPEAFIDDLLSCEYIISSSLHGLILSDAYGIPNKWVAFSDKVTGGSFKFRDYYSTTDRPNEDHIFVDCCAVFEDLMCNIDRYASVKHYLYEEKRLIDVFPRN